VEMRLAIAGERVSSELCFCALLRQIWWPTHQIVIAPHDVTAESLPMSAAGAKAALQGFRLQALYTLATVLRPDAADLVFHPEGKEDLDVYAGEELRRVIQVKGHAAPLSLSSLGLGQDDSFLSRAADLAPRPGLEIVVATFGPVGPELEGAWAGESNHRASVATKLRQQDFTDEEIANLFGSVRFEPVGEGALRHDSDTRFSISSQKASLEEIPKVLSICWWRGSIALPRTGGGSRRPTCGNASPA
jgi:hypothetical protein